MNKMAYIFYLGEVQLPIAPSKLQLKINNNNKTVTLINDGEINIIKTPGLTDISFEILLPNVKYPFATYHEGYRKADYYLSILDNLKTSLASFQFIVARTKPNGDYLFSTNMTVTLEDYTITEDADKYGTDVGVSIKLKQYRAYTTKTIKVDTPSNAGTIKTSTKKVATVVNSRPATKTMAKNHTVKIGETLWSICRMELGDGSKYSKIAKLNGISNPNLIKVGQVIKLG